MTDEAIGIFDRLFGRLFRRAERRVSETLQRDARTINYKIRLLTKIGDAQIEAKTSDRDAFAAAGNVIPLENFVETITGAKELVRPEGPDYLAFAERNHSVLRRIGPSFLAAFQFEGVEPADSILKAISALREFYSGARRALPKSLPTGSGEAKMTASMRPIHSRQRRSCGRSSKAGSKRGLSSGLRGFAAPRRVHATDSCHRYPSASSRLGRNFVAKAPNQVWLADLAYLHEAAVLDPHTRKIVGWSIRPTLHAAIALDALGRAIQRHRPVPELIHHSNHGIQDATEACRTTLAEAGLMPSI